MKDLNKLASKGYQAAFRKRSNYLKYKKLLSKHGYKTEMFKSSGPTIEGGYQRNAYYVAPHKMKKRRTMKRRTSQLGSLGIPIFRLPKF